MEQTRDSVLRYGEVVGCELLNLVVRQQEDQSQSRVGVNPMVVAEARVSIEVLQPQLVGLGPTKSDEDSASLRSALISAFGRSVRGRAR